MPARHYHCNYFHGISNMTIKTTLALLAIALVPAAAFGHGQLMTFHVNAAGDFESDHLAYYQPVLDLTAEQHDTVLEAGSYTVNAVVTNSLQTVLSPSTTDPAATNGLAVNSTYGFDLVGKLWFWDPVLGITDPQIAGVDVVATIVRSGVAFNVDKNSVFVSGGNLATSAAPYNGTNGFHNSTTFNIPPGSPVGLYAVGYQIRSTVNPNFPLLTQYGTSNVFYGIVTNGVPAGEDFDRGLAALAAVGVPEPSSMVLLGMGLAGAAVFAWRKRRAAGTTC